MASDNTQGSPQPKHQCRFLALPAELRNNVYRCVFERPGSKPVNILDAKANFPYSNLGATCRQIANEIVEYQTAAQAIYWETHTFFATPTLDFTPTSLLAVNTRIIQACAALPKNIRIRHFEIRVFNGWGPTYSTWDILEKGKVRIVTGNLRWGPRPRTQLMDHVVAREGFLPILPSGDGLDVARIARTVIDPQARKADLYF